MKKVTLNTVSTKKLELKKTAIANLQMSEEKMNMLVGGGQGVKTDDTSGLLNTNCTSFTFETK